ncbi:MAG: hypothetical protein ACTHJQ_22820 [Rhizobiaceae bacterium]
MAAKHQSGCYRTFHGVRWPNLCDMLTEEQEAEIRARKDCGHRIRIRIHPDGFRQAFIHPDDLTKPFKAQAA